VSTHFASEKAKAEPMIMCSARFVGPQSG